MINLCYLKTNWHEYDERIFSLCKLLNERDLIVASNSYYDTLKENNNRTILHTHNIDFEYISNLKFDNIILIDFYMMSNKDMIQLIATKSRDCEIVGFTCSLQKPSLTKCTLDIQRFKNSGCNEDEICLAVSLENNYGIDTSKLLCNSYILNPKICYKEISTVEEMFSFLKRNE